MKHEFNAHSKSRQKQLQRRVKELQKQGATIIEVYVCLFTSVITITFEYKNQIHKSRLSEFSIDLEKTIKN